MISTNLVTCVICTHNRLDVLPNAVNSYLEYIVDGTELLIVDSASDKSTGDYLSDLVQRYPQIRVVREDKLGVANARNAGVRNVKSEYIAFIDDDAKFTDGYIERLKGIIENYNPDVIGGPIYPYYNVVKPEWFKDDFETRIHGSTTGFVDFPRFSASNLIIRRSLFDKVGYFDPRYGTQGRRVHYGEETSFLLRSIEFQATYYYDLNLVIEHLVPFYKMDVLFSLLAQYRSGQTAFRTGSSAGIMTSANYASVMDLFFDDLNEVLVNNYEQRQEMIWEKLSHDFKTLGYISEEYRASFDSQPQIDSFDAYYRNVRNKKTMGIKDFLLAIGVLTKKYLASFRSNHA